MKNQTIGKRVALGFAIILALVVALAGISYYLLEKAKTESTFMATDALPGTIAMNDLNNNVCLIQISVLRVLLAKTPEERKKWEGDTMERRQAILKLMDDYDKTIHLPEDRAMFNDLIAARDRYVSARTNLFAICDAGKIDEAVAFNASNMRSAFLEYSGISTKLLRWNIDNSIRSSTESEKAVRRADFITTSLSLAVIVLGIVFATIIVISLKRLLSNIAGALNDNSNQVASAASQVSSSSQTLAEGASEQAASIEETSASLEELSSMTKRNAENAQKANELAKQARAAADKGAQDMQTMSSAMEAIKASSDDIAKIIKTIDEIAFQTNILALNAAVEAARAGEAGMGFAVVADEVRNLAQRSAQAAKETAAKIEGAISRTSQGVGITAKVADTLNEIVAKARQVDELAAEVASASSEQTNGITQINSAVGQMDKVTQSNAANAEESAAAAEELNAQAEATKASVAELMRLVGGNTANSANNAAPVLKSTSTVVRQPKHSANGDGIIHTTRRTSTRTAVPASEHAEVSASRRSEIPLDDDFKNF